jgi:hypothetical protein
VRTEVLISGGMTPGLLVCVGQSLLDYLAH